MAGSWQGYSSVLHRTAADADGLSTFRGGIMDAGATPDFLHHLLTKTFAELGATEPTSIIRTVSLKGHCFAGQKFRCEGFLAMLPAGEDEIKFYDESGRLMKTVSVLAQSQQKAA
jgi:hypothetical protein